MMLIKSIIISILFLASSLGAAEKGYHAKAFAGYNAISLQYHPGAKLKVRPGQIAGLALGYRFTPNFTGELEGSYRYNEVNRLELKGKSRQFAVPLSGDIKSFSIMANSKLELPFLPALVPYVGAGLGITAEYGNWNANIIEDSIWFDYEAGTETAISYQLMVGIRTPIANGYYCAAEFRALDSIIDHMCNHNRSVIFSYHKAF